MTITVRDALGVPIAALPVFVDLTGTGHAVIPPSVTSDAAGVARLAITSTRAETKTLRLRVGPAEGGVRLDGEWRLEFVHTGPAVAHSSVVAMSGPYVAADGVAAAPICVRVRDRFLNPVPDVRVLLEVTGGDNIVTQPAALTDAHGAAYGYVASRRVERKAVSARVEGPAGALTLAEHAELRFVDRPAINGGAAFVDADADGRCSPGDTLRVPLAETVILASSVAPADLLALPVGEDSFGTDARVALAPSGDALIVRLGSLARLRARGAFVPELRATNAPSGVGLASALPQGLIVSALTGLGARSGTFADVFADFASVAVPWSEAATSVALGDIDHDGDVDVVFGTAGGRVELWRNERARGFVALGSVAQLDEPVTAVAIADLDAQGLADIAVAGARRSVSVLCGNDDRTFASPKRVFEVGGTALAVVDLDRDGRTELVLGAADGSCWIGAVHPHSPPQQAFALATAPRSVAAGDLDGDGSPELVLATGAAVVAYSRGPGGHRVVATLPLPGESALAVALADLDVDGDLDVAVAGATGTRVFWNTRTGTFIDAGLRLGTQPAAALLAVDLDADGDADLISTGADGGLWLNQRPGFALARAELDVRGALSLACADFDRDGVPDLIASSSALPASLWRGSLAAVRGELDLGQTDPTLPVTRAVACRAADLDGDGDPDVVVALARGGTRVWRNDGDLNFVDTGQVLGLLDSTLGLALGDVDGDGDVDIVTGNMLEQPERVYFNDGRGVFIESLQPIGTGHTMAVALGDVDRDGDLDLLAGNIHVGGASSRLYLNDGRGGFVDSGQVLGVLDARALVLGDLDADADLDLVIGTVDGTLAFWNNDGRGGFEYTRHFAMARPLGALALGDLDGDSAPDLYAAVDATTGDQILVNDRRGRFADAGLRLGNEHTIGVTLADIDRDGDLDAVTTVFGGRPRVRLNDSSGAWQEPARLTADPCTALCVADLDGDGDADVVLAGADGRLRVLSNR